MAISREQALNYTSARKTAFLDGLKEFLHLPSVSTEPEHRGDIDRTATWLKDRLANLGAADAAVYPTGGMPAVCGSIAAKGALAAPTLLVYGHYDVQPVDPVDQWISDPFTGRVDGDLLYARGASDMKGQIAAVLAAVEAVQRSGGLPVNVRFLFEGEEEIGSPNLSTFIRSHRDLLKADYCLNPDAGMIAPDRPAICHALRGLAYFELRIKGPAMDLHSGMFGGAVHNPAQVLCDLVAGMHDKSGRVTLPGFYDRVRELTEDERAELARLEMDDEYYIAQTGAPSLWGEEGFTASERVGARPTLEVNGLLSGFTGTGSKTVLPAQAMAKISMRLVPDQDPKEVQGQFERYITTHVPQSVTWEVEQFSAGPPVITERNSAGSRSMAAALETVWGSRPVFKREGGSVPVATYLSEILGIPSVLTGFGLPEDHIHSPNERLHLPTWYRGMDAIIHFLYNLSE
ncbi:MAG TPA: dipeptidase [Spirochaetia bacterium]|nr:dipeptidase [Spirochaetia bacterium]